jgi:hypothetical protein
MITLKVPNTAKRLLQIFLTISFISGSLFFILNTWVVVEGEYGPEKHPAQFVSLQIHAISAFSIMVLYGAFWGAHLFLGWRTRRSRNTGIGLTTVIGLQVITAYLLYYVASDMFRQIVMWLHLCIGFSLPVWLMLHIRAAKQSKLISEEKIRATSAKTRQRGHEGCPQ